MSEITFAATQMTCDWDTEGNLARGEQLIREAAGAGAQVILLQELFEAPYFCKDEAEQHFELARPVDDNPVLRRFQDLARELEVVLPISFFERSGNTFFNSLAMFDADGSQLGVYRKSHIPQGPGYEEKFYFSPGNTGFKVWNTRYGCLGAAICWDQWFPEAARCMALMGAEMLLYPTAIGSEPGDEGVDSMQHWQNTMCGHAAANIMPVVASNRIGLERATTSDVDMTFYGSSFIADHCGNRVETANRSDQAVLTHAFDLDEIRDYRETWGVFRDRRPETYAALTTLDGRTD